MASMMKSKAGNINNNTITTWIYTFILVIVLFKVIADLYPQGAAAGDELNASGIPLGSFFAGGGIVWLLVGAGILFLMVRSFIGKGK